MPITNILKVSDYINSEKKPSPIKPSIVPILNLKWGAHV